MAKSDLLNFLKDINYVYNDCGMHDCVSKMLEDFEAEIREKAISDYLQFVYDNASNEEYANEDGWAMSDLIDLEFKYLEQLKESE